MKKILLYHIYPINNWREITDTLFQKLPFEKIVVHVSLPEEHSVTKEEIENYFKKFKIDSFLYSKNTGIGEVDALNSFVRTQDFSNFDILTYMHCKGVTKPDNKNIMNWSEMMRYFIIEKIDKCESAFKKGFVTFGINKSIPIEDTKGFIGSNFYYEGNFVSLNLRKVNLSESVQNFLENSYWGLEGFWGKLCSYEDGYTIFNSGINHYMMSVPEKSYTTFLGRAKYNLVRLYYKYKSQLLLGSNGSGLNQGEVV